MFGEYRAIDDGRVRPSARAREPHATVHEISLAV